MCARDILSRNTVGDREFTSDCRVGWMKLLMMESWRLLRCRLLIGWKEDNRTGPSSSGNIRGRRQVDAPSEARVRTDKPDVLKPLVSWRGELEVRPPPDRMEAGRR